MNDGRASATGRRRVLLPRQSPFRVAAVAAALAAGLAAAIAGPAAAAAPAVPRITVARAVTDSSGRSGTGMPGGPAQRDVLRLRPMPAGTVRFGRSHGRLTVQAVVYGLTPGSSHRVDLRLPGPGVVPFTWLTASSAGQARATLASSYTGRVLPGSQLVIRMGTSRRGVAASPIAVAWAGPGPLHPLVAVEAGSRSPLRGRATVTYSPARRTLTVVLSASGLSPGRHAAHIHAGSCVSQGPVLYMLGNLVARPGGQVVRAVRTFHNVTAPIPAHGWYLNIHQGSTATILTAGGQPTIFFRPLLCASIR